MSGLAVERDLDALRPRIERWVGGGVGTIERPASGYSCETLLVDRRLVLRLPPVGEGIFPAYDLAQQAAVQEACAAAGVPVAGPVRHERDPSFLGCEFLAMPFVDGAIPSDFTPADAWLRGLATDADRKAVWAGFLDAVAGIHATPADGIGLRSGLAAELDFWDEYVAWATPAPPPLLLEILAWCRGNVPDDPPPPGLLWGDVRLGNVIFDPVTLAPRAVLDWDMTSAGPFELDLAWFLALDRLTSDLTGMTVAGFGTREEAIRRAEARLGRALHDLHWYEVFALARASAVSGRISFLQAAAGRRSGAGTAADDPAATAAARLIAGS